MSNQNLYRRRDVAARYLVPPLRGFRERRRAYTGGGTVALDRRVRLGSVAIRTMDVGLSSIGVTCQLGPRDGSFSG